MVGIGYAFFFQLPGKSKKRILHPAKVIGAKDDNYTATVEEQDLSIQEDTDVLVYYEKSREFMQQSACIDSIEETEPELIINLTTKGNPSSAESRQMYRVSTVMMDLEARFGVEPSCSILDVSSTGFAIVASECHNIGNVVEASFQVEDQTYTGQVSIQSVRELSKGRIRYGLNGIEEKSSTYGLLTGLQLMSVKTQREQLRRLSGAT